MNRDELYKKLSADFEEMRKVNEISEETFIGSSFGPHEDIINWTIDKIVQYRTTAVLELPPLEEVEIDDAIAHIGLIFCEAFLNRKKG